jgi:hypothetical protein
LRWSLKARKVKLHTLQLALVVLKEVPRARQGARKMQIRCKADRMSGASGGWMDGAMCRGGASGRGLAAGDAAEGETS